jgi:hypothetical protein
MSCVQQLQQGPFRKLEYEHAFFPIGLSPAGISPTQFCKPLSPAAIAVTIKEIDRSGGRAGVTCPTASTVCASVNAFSAQHRRQRLVRTRCAGGLRRHHTFAGRHDQTRISNCSSTPSQSGSRTATGLQYCHAGRGDP